MLICREMRCHVLRRYRRLLVVQLRQKHQLTIHALFLSNLINDFKQLVDRRGVLSQLSDFLSRIDERLR